MITKYHTYRNYYRFKAFIYNVPQSFNRPGFDLYPRYFLKPETLLEVMAYSRSPKSTDNGFEKDKESGFFLKNRTEINDTVSYDEIDIQWEFLRLRPPYWFHDQASYGEFVSINMDPIRQNTLEGLYVSADSKAVVVGVDENPDIPVEHTYKEITQWTTREFRKEVTQSWPREKGVIISKVS